ncbi:response regulator [Flavisolibacter nicotianae]|uniref:response regulator n=1 Tax=Flavisolibacter nicotianae TaxID=2364882 RepID=UPI000EB4F101|nr:response regulator [Flavisolibacter nicotianae]
MLKEVRILLVEDNEGDIVLTMEALKEAKIRNEIDVVKDGEAALQFLRKAGVYKEASTPDLIFLDINLPKIDGMEILSIIKNDEQLKVIPVIMLTTSDAERDIMKSYYNHANCYITKPVDLDKFMSIIQTIKNFWINIVKLPKTND